MSLINSANPGSQIDLMCMVYRVLNRASGPITEEQLLGLCRPDTLWENEDQKIRLPRELRFWSSEEHQLWEKNSADLYELKIPIDIKTQHSREISCVVRKVLFETNMESVFDHDKKWEGVDQLIAMLSCVLALPEFSALQGRVLNKETLRDALAKFLPAESRLNDAELPTALEYAHFLGFIEPGEDEGYVVDPTVAIADALESVLTSGKAMGVKEFVASMAQILPVLDGGTFRLEVESAMCERNFITPPINQLSCSLSHALYRLRISGLVGIEELADDPYAMTFVLPTGEKKFSRIHLL